MNKKKSTFLIIAIIAICFFIYIFRGNFNKGDYSQTYYDLNTVSNITLYNVKESDSKEILDECGKILLDIDNTMSKTRDYSDVTKINQNAGKGYINISDKTFEVIKTALHFSDISDGVFDISIGPVVDLWGIGTDNARVPDKNEIKDKLSLVNYKDISIDEKNNSVKKGDIVYLDFTITKNSSWSTGWNYGIGKIPILENCQNKYDLTLNGWEGRNTGEIAIKNGIIDIFELGHSPTGIAINTTVYIGKK